MMVNGYIQVRITSVGTKEPWKMPIHLNVFSGKDITNVFITKSIWTFLCNKVGFLTKGLSLNIKGSYNSGYTHRKNRYKEIPYYTAHRDPKPMNYSSENSVKKASCILRNLLIVGEIGIWKVV